MRKLAATILAILLVVAVSVALLLQNRPTNSIQIHMASHPFPLAIGQANLLFSLTDSSGTPIDGASIRVSAQMDHPGMLPVTGHSSHSAGGEYSVSVIWPMMGQWLVDVSAELPDRHDALQEQFQVFVYTIPPNVSGIPASYPSVSEIKSVRNANPDQELWIVIPQGAQALLREGHWHDFELVPEEIHLKLSGQNTLVIRNDDIADHVIGPFFVRSGETVRQRYSSPTVYVGRCSIRASATVSIIVES